MGERNIEESPQFASEYVPPPPCPAPPEPPAQKAPIAATAAATAGPELARSAATAAELKKPPITTTAAKPQDKEMMEEVIAGTRKLHFNIDANKALEATFAELNGTIDATGSKVGPGLVVTSVSETSVLLWTND